MVSDGVTGERLKNKGKGLILRIIAGTQVSWANNSSRQPECPGEPFLEAGGTSTSLGGTAHSTGPCRVERRLCWGRGSSGEEMAGWGYHLLLSIPSRRYQSLTEWLLSKGCFSWDMLILACVLRPTWASRITFLRISLPILKVGVIITFTSKGILGWN